jgi:hypothetical protein
MKLIKKKKSYAPVFTLRKFYDVRNKILIMRETGGLGDLLMCRMMFEDFKKIDPELEIIFACPKRFHPALLGHPYIDVLLDHHEVNLDDYIATYNITRHCVRYEISISPFSGDNRSDIWANHCGVKLTHHNMHITIPQEYIEQGQKAIAEVKKDHSGPCVIICPISASMSKNLTDVQLEGLVSGLLKLNCFVCASHSLTIPILSKLNIPTFTHTTIPQWMGIH